MITIKPIPKSQLPELYALRQAVLRLPLGLNLFNEDLEVEATWLRFGAYLDGRIVGCVMLTPLTKTKIKLRQMCVFENIQKQGIGRQLVEFAQNWCFQNNFKIIELHARDIAINFYKKMDYKIIGEPFLEVGIDHVKMVKQLHNK